MVLKGCISRRQGKVGFLWLPCKEMQSKVGASGQRGQNCLSVPLGHLRGMGGGWVEMGVRGKPPSRGVDRSWVETWGERKAAPKEEPRQGRGRPTLGPTQVLPLTLSHESRDQTDPSPEPFYF